MTIKRVALLCCSFVMFALTGMSQRFTLVELNSENMFDCLDDEGKDDGEFLPDGPRRWTRSRYWRKLNNIGQELLSSSHDIPDLVALVEVENDTVMRDLTRRSLLGNAGYQYLMTDSPDARGIDVALLYQPSTFRPICYETIEVPSVGDMSPTRDILYVKGETVGDDTLHVFVVHAPSRYGGERQTRHNRKQVAEVMLRFIGEVADVSQSNIIIAGDFNDYADSPSLQQYYQRGLLNATQWAKGTHGARGTYRYQGDWQSIDHILVSPALYKKTGTVYINDASFLLEDEPKYGGRRPKRTYQGFRYQPGYSDHLPLVLTLSLGH